MTDNRSDGTTASSSADATGTGGRFGNVGSSVRGAASSARTRVSDAYGSARSRASDAYSNTRQSASDGLDSAPLAAVAGGLALGVIAGALLPRTRRETELLGGVGRQINETAREAFSAARQAGSDDLGLSRDAAKSQVQGLLDKARHAATAAGGAAAQSVKNRRGGAAPQQASKDPFAGPQEY